MKFVLFPISYVFIAVIVLFGPQFSCCDAGDGPYRRSADRSYRDSERGSDRARIIVYNEKPNGEPASYDDRKKFEQCVAYARQVFWGNSGFCNFLACNFDSEAEIDVVEKPNILEYV